MERPNVMDRPIVVAGHACLDLIPSLPAGVAMTPGTLTHVGPMRISTGGCVPNVGLALHRLGRPVRLIASVGDDALGDVLASHLRSFDARLGDALIVVPGATTSYSVVVDAPGRDRAFWHCAGVNDAFDSDAVADAALADAAWLHFGYPPIMRRVCDDPAALARLFARAQAAGARTSLDLCSIDANSFAGRVDWRRWLAAVLPSVDVFAPSFDETCVALGTGALSMTRASVACVADELRALGARAVLLKLGDVGAFYRDEAGEAYAPCRAVEVAGATGAGDCTIAGFLAGLTTGRDPGAALRLAVAVGAASCERPDATGGVPTLDAIDARLAAGWRTSDRLLEGWPSGERSVAGSSHPTAV